MTKKPVKNVRKQLAALDAMENTELWNAITKLENKLKDYNHAHIAELWDAVRGVGEQLTDIRHRMSNQGARLDGAWGKLTTLERALTDKEVTTFLKEHEALHAAFGHKPTPEGQFCVIGDKASHQYPITRKWHGNQEQAEQYAASLCRNQPSCTELLVVKVVSKVGRKEPDIKVTRV